MRRNEIRRVSLGIITVPRVKVGSDLCQYEAVSEWVHY
jgi:hypothetical protein